MLDNSPVNCLSCRRELVRCNEATDEAMSLHAHSAHGCVGCCRYMRFVEVDSHVRELCALEFHYGAGIPWSQWIKREAYVFVVPSCNGYAASFARKYDDCSSDCILGFHGATHSMHVICVLSDVFRHVQQYALMDWHCQWCQQMFWLQFASCAIVLRIALYVTVDERQWGTSGELYRHCQVIQFVCSFSRYCKHGRVRMR